jgi:hypothetical protein
MYGLKPNMGLARKNNHFYWSDEQLLAKLSMWM